MANPDRNCSICRQRNQLEGNNCSNLLRIFAFQLLDDCVWLGLYVIAVACSYGRSREKQMAGPCPKRPVRMIKADNQNPDLATAAFLEFLPTSTRAKCISISSSHYWRLDYWCVGQHYFRLFHEQAGRTSREPLTEQESVYGGCYPPSNGL